jgi:adenylate cyclase
VAERGSRRRRRRIIAAAVAAAVVLAMAGAWWWGRRAHDEQAAPAAVAAAVMRPARGAIAVAVRPTMPEDAQEAGVARSLAAELTTAVSAVPGYRVASPIAADAPRPVGVDFVLEGTVQRERSVVRVNLRLVDARRDSTMWAMQRQGVTDSLFALQDTLTRAAVGVLASALR